MAKSRKAGGAAVTQNLSLNQQPSPPAADEKRREQIALAAYYRAERRGFQGGSPLDDWLAAEAEIDGDGAATTAKKRPGRALNALEQLKIVQGPARPFFRRG